MEAWPYYHQLPSLEQVPAIVQQTMPWGQRSSADRFRPRLACQRLNIIVKAAALRADRGGLEAMLVPAFTPEASYLFRVVVDSFLSPNQQHLLAYLDESEQRKFEKLVRRFRVAHELGHTLLYAWDRHQPNRQLPNQPYWARDNHDVEAFCDAFAYHILKNNVGGLDGDILLAIAAIDSHNQWAKLPERFRGRYW
jgi:hypothetical protein